MDSERFDVLTRSVAIAASRRNAIRGLTAGLVAGVLGRALGEPAAAQQVEADRCVNLGKSCRRRRGERRPRCCGRGTTCKRNRCECRGNKKRCGTECIGKNGCCRNNDCPSGQKCDNKNRCVGSLDCSANDDCPTGVCTCAPGHWTDTPDAGECQKPTYTNTFRRSLRGWFDFLNDTNTASPVSDDTIVLANNRATVQPRNAYDPDLQTTAMTNLGGFSSVFPDGGYDVSLDIFLDPGERTPFRRFEYTSAINSNSTAPNCESRRDFVFHAGVNAAGDAFCLAANNNAETIGVDAIDVCENVDRVDITALPSGRYTFRHEFRDQAGVLAVRMVVVNRDDEPVLDQILSNPADTIATTGGNRYAWFPFNNFPGGVEIDNSKRRNF